MESWVASEEWRGRKGSFTVLLWRGGASLRVFKPDDCQQHDLHVLEQAQQAVERGLIGERALECHDWPALVKFGTEGEAPQPFAMTGISMPIDLNVVMGRCEASGASVPERRGKPPDLSPCTWVVTVQGAPVRAGDALLPEVGGLFRAVCRRSQRWGRR